MVSNRACAGRPAAHHPERTFDALAAGYDLFGNAIFSTIAAAISLRGLFGSRRSFGNLQAKIAGADSFATPAQWIAGQFDPSLSWKDVEWARGISVRSGFHGPYVSALRPHREDVADGGVLLLGGERNLRHRRVRAAQHGAQRRFGG
jgi:hypothetical protein